MACAALRLAGDRTTRPCRHPHPPRITSATSPNARRTKSVRSAPLCEWPLALQSGQLMPGSWVEDRCVHDRARAFRVYQEPSPSPFSILYSREIISACRRKLGNRRGPASRRGSHLPRSTLPTRRDRWAGLDVLCRCVQLLQCCSCSQLPEYGTHPYPSPEQDQESQTIPLEAQGGESQEEAATHRK